MIRSLFLLVAAVSTSASNLGLLASDSASLSPTSLAEAYAKEIPKVGSLMPKELLREHVRKDLMPRLMSNQDDRTAYELGLNIFEKLNRQPVSLVEVHNRIEQGKKLDRAQATEIAEFNNDITRDMELLHEKIRESTSSNKVSQQTLKLLANSVQGYACAFKATEISVLSQGKEQKKDCTMPFPGAFVMLEQKISVPEKVDLFLPPTDEAEYLQPQQWMSGHLRRMLWCKDSFEEHGFDADSTCDAISAALDMPRHDEVVDERASLVQIEASQAKGEAAPAAMAPPVLAPAVGALIQQEEQMKDSLTVQMSSAERILKQVAENARHSQEFAEQAANVGQKLSLQQKRMKLRKLKEKLALDKSRLATMI